MQTPSYKILTADTIEGIERQTAAFIEMGWQPASDVRYIASEKLFIHEMLYFPRPDAPAPAPAVDTEKFAEKLANMNQKVKDLLDINRIYLACSKDGKLYTHIGDKVVEGISPNAVLLALKASKHCPVDLDEAMVINAVESVI